MLKSFEIQNFKSIFQDKISLGLVNVFIGENGCGKSNILEALAFASCAKENRLDTEGLYSKGIRVAKPSLMMSSFQGLKNNKSIQLAFDFGDNDVKGSYSLSNNDENGIREGWHLERNFDKDITEIQPFDSSALMHEFIIYTLSTKSLRGIFTESRKTPLGINGENLDVVVANMNKKELTELSQYYHLISWLEEVVVDNDDALKFKGYKLNKSDSRLYFKDKFMSKKNNFFNAENANEGVLHILFYLTLFISELTPNFFAIDNIENSLNPHLCRELSKVISKLAIEKNKQVLMTTHNPAILDGLDLNDDRIRLFEVYRNDAGQTKTRRILINANNKPEKLKLSELWMRGYLGAISQNF